MRKDRGGRRGGWFVLSENERVLLAVLFVCMMREVEVCEETKYTQCPSDV